MSLALTNPFLWLKMTMKNISLSSRYKGVKTALIVSAGQKWVRLENEYLHSYCIYDAKIWMTGGQGGDLSARKRISFIIYFWPGYKLSKNGWVTVLLFLVIRKTENSTILKILVVWKTENSTLLRSTILKRVISDVPHALMTPTKKNLIEEN